MEDQAPYGEEIKLQRFLGWSYSDVNLMPTFNPFKYEKSGMNIKNPHYVYDNEGFLMAVLCGETKSKAIWECKKYILVKRFNLVPLIHRFNILFKIHQKNKSHE